MILVVTTSEDLGADFVIRHLLALGCAYTRLDTDKLGSTACFFGAAPEPELHIEGRRLRKSEVMSIWARRFALSATLQQVKPEHVAFVRRELAVVMDAFLEDAPDIFQINTSGADRTAGNRLLQAERAKRLGFAVPETLTTQDADAARAFLDRHRDVVCKALSFGRLSAAPGAELVAYTSRVPPDIALDGIAHCPALFQERIESRFDWRITTIGSRVFGARAPHSTEIDWRAEEDAATRFYRADPPADISEKLVRLAANSGLVYGAHDLIETPNGAFFFLETNPAGQFGWLEVTTGMPIGQAIAEALARRSAC